MKKIIKKTLTILSIICVQNTVSVKAQITLEFTIDTCWDGSSFYYTDIGSNDYKYVFIDDLTNSFSLKNLDMTPYLTNILIPTTTDSTVQGFTVAYITKSLWDCDSTTIEYAFENPWNAYTPFYVFRTDGTLLFQKDSVNGPFCTACYGGSFDGRPVKNFPDTTRLFLQKWNPIGNFPSMFIYTLCGTLPETSVFDFSKHQQFVKIFPNPTSQQLNFELMLPDNINRYELIIMNSGSQELRRANAGATGNRISIDVQNYSSGTYYYSLASKNKVLQTGKFTITK